LRLVLIKEGETPMMCAVTIRMLKPGSFERFREDWEPRPLPPELARVLILRNDQDPNQVLTASFLDMSAERLDTLRDDPTLLAAEESRLARIDQYEEALIFKGFFEVVEDLSAPTASTG
jgi:hypothetical protein